MDMKCPLWPYFCLFSSLTCGPILKESDSSKYCFCSAVDLNIASFRIGFKIEYRYSTWISPPFYQDVSLCICFHSWNQRVYRELLKCPGIGSFSRNRYVKLYELTICILFMCFTPSRIVWSRRSNWVQPDYNYFVIKFPWKHSSWISFIDLLSQSSYRIPICEFNCCFIGF